MPLSFLFRSRRGLIGLDMGAVGLRAAQVSRDGDTVVVTRCSSAEVTPSEGPATDESPLERRLRGCLEGGGFRGRRIAMGLGAGNVEFHPLELPQALLAQSPVQRAEAIRWEASRLISDDLNHVELRHWSLPSPKAPGPNAVVAVVKRGIVMDAMNACTRAGFVCTCVDTHATALCRLGCLLRSSSRQAVWGMLDVGAAQTTLLVCVDTAPVLVRVVGSGSRAWTERIAEFLQVSRKTAEIEKRDHGIGGGRDAAAPAEDGLGDLVLTALRSGMTELATEIKRSYEYVLSFHSDRTASDLILVGGGSLLRNLPSVLTGVLGIPVRCASAYLSQPECRLRFEGTGGRSLESAGLAVGLAVQP